MARGAGDGGCRGGWRGRSRIRQGDVAEELFQGVLEACRRWPEGGTEKVKGVEAGGVVGEERRGQI